MQIEHRMDAKRGNLIWLSDGRTEAAAALDFGICIVHLSCAGKPNLFYSQPDDLSDGLATEAGWRIYGGHRFWSSPESTRSYYPDNAPVACERSRTASACGSGPTPGPALKRRSSCAFCRAARV